MPPAGPTLQPGGQPVGAIRVITDPASPATKPGHRYFALAANPSTVSTSS